jgi:prepilin-type processing-associated H-X9-DG protein
VITYNLFAGCSPFYDNGSNVIWPVPPFPKNAPILRQQDVIDGSATPIISDYAELEGGSWHYSSHMDKGASTPSGLNAGFHDGHVDWRNFDDFDKYVLVYYSYMYF